MKAKILSFACCLTFFTVIELQAQTPLALPYATGFDTPAEKAGRQEFRTGFLSALS
jgi:hypothetical protein